MRYGFGALVGLLAATSAAAQAPAAAPASPVAASPEDVLDLDLSTGGRVQIQLRPDKAPAHVERIKTLVRQGFYDGLIFHRVVEGFMAQTGDPTGTGEGGSKLPDLKAEFNELPHLRGTVSMARSEHPDSANSQFFICFTPQLALDGRYTVVGRVIKGMEFVDRIERGEPPANPSRILRASIEADKVPPPVFVAAPPPSAADPTSSAAAAAALLDAPAAPTPAATNELGAAASPAPTAGASPEPADAPRP